jgi:hypothetical protein
MMDKHFLHHSSLPTQIIASCLTVISVLLCAGSARGESPNHSTELTSAFFVYLPLVRRSPQLPPNTTFEFEAAVPFDQREVIPAAIGMAYEYLPPLGDQDSGGTSVRVFATLDTLINDYAQWFGIPTAQASQHWGTCNTAIAGPQVIFINSGCWWATAPDYARAKVVVHEYFHVMQNNLVAPHSLVGVPDDQVPLGGPRWLIEGSAEYFGWRVISSNELYVYETARQAQIDQARLCATPLESMETAVEIASACPQSYSLAFVAGDYLAALHGDSGLIAFYDSIGQGSNWQSAFQSAFGTTITTFYQQFQAYRDDL